LHDYFPFTAKLSTPSHTIQPKAVLRSIFEKLFDKTELLRGKVNFKLTAYIIIKATYKSSVLIK